MQPSATDVNLATPADHAACAMLLRGGSKTFQAASFALPADARVRPVRQQRDAQGARMCRRWRGSASRRLFRTGAVAVGDTFDFMPRVE
jgi:hypothetical protein